MLIRGQLTKKRKKMFEVGTRMGDRYGSTFWGQNTDPRSTSLTFLRLVLVTFPEVHSRVKTYPSSTDKDMTNSFFVVGTRMGDPSKSQFWDQNSFRSQLTEIRKNFEVGTRMGDPSEVHSRVNTDPRSTDKDMKTVF